MNKVMLMGRLTRDPETRYSQGETAMAVARFSLAVDRKYKREGEADADFLNCTAFGKLGEFVEKYLKKGTKVCVIGRIQNDNYTNKNGEKVYSVQIIAEEIEFAESKGAGSPQAQPQPQQAQAQPQATQPQAPQPTGAVADDGFLNIPNGIEEELPFNTGR